MLNFNITERLMVIQEYYPLTIVDAWQQYEEFQTEKKLLELMHQVILLQTCHAVSF